MIFGYLASEKFYGKLFLRDLASFGLLEDAKTFLSNAWLAKTFLRDLASCGFLEDTKTSLFGKFANAWRSKTF